MDFFLYINKQTVHLLVILKSNLGQNQRINMLVVRVQ